MLRRDEGVRGGKETGDHSTTPFTAVQHAAQGVRGNKGTKTAGVQQGSARRTALVHSIEWHSRNDLCSMFLLTGCWR